MICNSRKHVGGNFYLRAETVLRIKCGIFRFSKYYSEDYIYGGKGEYGRNGGVT